MKQPWPRNQRTNVIIAWFCDMRIHERTNSMLHLLPATQFTVRWSCYCRCKITRVWYRFISYYILHYITLRSNIKIIYYNNSAKYLMANYYHHFVLCKTRKCGWCNLNGFSSLFISSVFMFINYKEPCFFSYQIPYLWFDCQLVVT